MSTSRSATKKSAVAVHDDKNEFSSDDFNTMMDKKLNQLKSSMIGELIENMKVLIQSKFWKPVRRG